MPQPEPVAFSIFGVDIMWYALCITFAIIVGTAIGCYRAPKFGLASETILNYVMICIPAAIIGARAYYVIFNWSMYQGNLFLMVNTRAGGLAIHGGLIAGLGTAFFLCYLWKIKPLNLMDLTVPSIAIAQAIGRWGNYFNSEAHGGPTDLPWAVHIDGLTYHPTFLYESIWCFFLFLFLIFISKHRKFNGQIFLLYGILYSIERFAVESLRTDSLMIGPLKQAQVISLIIIVIFTIAYVMLSKKSKNAS